MVEHQFDGGLISKISFEGGQAMDKLGVQKEPFTYIIFQYLLKFVSNDGNAIHPPTILMCQLIRMQVVCTLQTSTLIVGNLKETFDLHGYVQDQLISYMQPTNNEVKEIIFTTTIHSSWDPLWIKKNKEFEKDCDANPAFAYL